MEVDNHITEGEVMGRKNSKPYIIWEGRKYGYIFY